MRNYFSVVWRRVDGFQTVVEYFDVIGLGPESVTVRK